MTNKEYLGLALPFVISTVTQPLLGAVDTAVIGRLDDPAYIGGIAVGAVIFNTMYWLFGFLRVSTSGFSAQSLGSDREEDFYLSYMRPLLWAIVIGCLFIVFQGPIKNLAWMIYKPETMVMRHASTYYDVLIWGAPMVLLGYVNLGWLMGRKKVKASMWLQISSNVLNILLDLYFVFQLKMGVGGVAAATLIAQAYSFILGSALILLNISPKHMWRYRGLAFESSSMQKMLTVNSDLMIRTLCLLIMTNMFIAKGAAFGTLVLASNALIYQIQYVISYIYDGFANASSVFAGKYLGASDRKGLMQVFKISNRYAFGLGFIITMLLVIFQKSLLGFFTTMSDVIEMSSRYYFWLFLFTNVIGIGMIYYGIFTGCTYTAPIRNSMIVALAVFVIAYFIGTQLYGNHGLWLAFVLFSLTRSVVLYMYRNRLLERLFFEPDMKKNSRGVRV
ncbi:MAG: MATE family efflux transporter [Clostridia bacterium]|nr:MATE family efflux transporter [Clostridia bacterium]